MLNPECFVTVPGALPQWKVLHSQDVFRLTLKIPARALGQGSKEQGGIVGVSCVRSGIGPGSPTQEIP